jgi:dephospho-CoA kinase
MRKTDKPLLVGITGGIGSGKSMVAKIFSILGIPVYDSDSRAKWLMEHNPEVKDAVIAQFGSESYLENGALNRVYLAQQVFSDAEKTSQINEIVHPAVRKDTEEWVQKHANQQYVLKEAALLFEAGVYKELDFIITVIAPIHLRVQRVILRDKHRSREDVMQIINKQWPDSEKRALSQAIIHNDENRFVIQQVLDIHTKLMRK